jgi:hypothetical protein
LGMHKIYRFGTAAFPESTSEFIGFANRVLRPAVVQVSPDMVELSTVSGSGWDRNGSGTLDDIKGMGLLDTKVVGGYTFKSELASAITLIDDSCVEGSTHASLVFDAPYWLHWMVLQNHAAGQNTLTFYCPYCQSDLKYYPAEMFVSKFDLPASKVKLTPTSVSCSPSSKTCTLSFSNPADVPAFLASEGWTVSGDASGASGEVKEVSELTKANEFDIHVSSCSFIHRKGQSQVVLTHEFLHHNASGFFRHVTHGVDMPLDLDGQPIDQPPINTNIMHYSIYNHTSAVPILCRPVFYEVQPGTIDTYSQCLKIRE